jgi:hypothetical protein
MSDPVWFTYTIESEGTCNPIIIYHSLSRYMETSNMPRIVTDWYQQYALMECNSHHKCA